MLWRGHVRTQKLDASYRDLLKALLFCLNPFKNRKRLIDELCETWSNQGDALPALSVRTALDAWLSILNLPRGSEVIMTGINIPDMVTILEHHGLQIVPLDLNLETIEIPDNAEPSAANWRSPLSRPMFISPRKH